MTGFLINGYETAGRTLPAGGLGEISASGILAVVGRAVTVEGQLATLVNSGSISSAIGYAVVVSGRSATIENRGEMTSARAVIYSPNISSGTVEVVNSGTITATSDVTSAISLASGGLQLTNFGLIRSLTAPTIAIAEGSRTESNVLVNKGVISSTGNMCIRTDRSHDRIVNEGTIFGSINLGDGTNSLRNKGTINGDVITGSGADVIDMRDTFFTGAIYAGGRGDKVRGGESHDVVFGQAGDDTIIGNGGRDLLSGAYGQDTIQGGNGADTLVGGMGVDRLAGGAGADVFDFNTLGNSTPYGRDHIADFQRGLDKIDLSDIIARIEASPRGGAVMFIGTAEFTADRQIRVANFGNHVQVEFNNRGNTAPEFVLLVESVAALTATDFIL